MSADLLARLIAAGTPAALVAEVAMLAARADTTLDAIEGRRAKDRERQARRRHAMSRDITLDSVTTRDVTDEPAPAPSPLPSPQTPQLTPHPHPHPDGSDAPARKARAWACPEGVDLGHWADLLSNRKRKRQANTATAYQRLLRDLEKFADEDWPPGRLVEFAAERGWAAIFDPRQHHENRNAHRPANDRSEPQNPMVRALRNAEAREAGHGSAGVQPRLHS